MILTGTHYIIEMYGVKNISFKGEVQPVLEEAADIMATRVGSLFHQFEPKGVTGIILISESHISIHT
jgi:S-adenosylmethionine decarboxylase